MLKLVVILTIPFLFGIIITFLRINIYKIIQNRSIFIFINLIIATIVSPPDIFSQIIITIILSLFFEFIFFYNLTTTLQISKKCEYGKKYSFSENDLFLLRNCHFRLRIVSNSLKGFARLMVYPVCEIVVGSS